MYELHLREIRKARGLKTVMRQDMFVTCVSESFDKLAGDETKISSVVGLGTTKMQQTFEKAAPTKFKEQEWWK